MNTSPFQGAVGIDTNVFEHLLNKENNAENHINHLLTHLQQQSIALLVDDGDRIAGEYNHHLDPIIRRADDERNEIFILRYWMTVAPRYEVTVNGAGQLMTTIRRVIKEPSEAVDRIFVYICISEGKILVSNDEMHIVIGPTRESRLGERRQRLLRDSRGIRPNGADILTSKAAHAAIQD